MDFIERDAQEVFEEEFLNFAGYNLQRRALPDVRDGLKWSARKLLHAQMLGKLTYDKPFKKAVKSVAQAMSFSYTHGDSSAYGTFIRMAKPFVMNVPLQEANGNYGTLISPDDHSASRYVEMRGSEAAAHMLKDLEKDTVLEWEDTYDLEGQFPKVLPAKGLWGLVNGCLSIGSGMSCSVAPMNLKELNEALIKLLWNSEATDDEIIVMPDFPTGGIILNAAEVKESLKCGNGPACKVRAAIEFDESERCLIVKEMPYSTYTNTVCSEIAALMEENENCGIANFVDYTGQKPDLRIYLTKHANPNRVLKLLYKHTSLQTYYSINMMMLENGTTPKLFGLREAMLAHLKHETEVYVRSFQYDKRKAEARVHIIDALIAAYSVIDDVVHAIKNSNSSAAASVALQKLLGIDEIQAKAILDLKLARLSKLDITKLRNEHEDLLNEIDRITKILNDETLLKHEIETGLREVAAKFGHARRTQIMDIESVEDEEPCEIRQLQIALTSKNAVYASETSTLYSQKRGGAGTKIKLDKNEAVITTAITDTAAKLLFFTTDGMLYRVAASTFTINSKTPLEIEGNICAMVVETTKDSQILFFTRQGFVKKSKMSEYKVSGHKPIKAIVLDDGDSISKVVIADNPRVGVLTARGYFLMFNTADIRAIGRVARGVKAIALTQDDYVVSAREIPTDTQTLLFVTRGGKGKQTSLSEFNLQNRATRGTRAQKLDEKDAMADFKPMASYSDIIISSNTARIKMSAAELQQSSKAAAGTSVIKLANSDYVIEILSV